MKDVINRFLQYLELDRNSAQNTILAYQTDVRQFLQVLTAISDRPIEPAQIDVEIVEKYASWLNRQGYKTATVARKIAAVRTLLDYMYSYEGVDTRTVLDSLDLPQNPRQPPKVLTTGELGKLIQTASEDNSPRAIRDAAALSLLYATGLRAAEIIALNTADIDLRSGIIRKDETYPDSISLGDALPSLKMYIEKGRPYLLRTPEVQALFVNQRGQRLSRQGLWLIVKRWAAEAGLSGDISPQTIRHSLVRHLLDQGKSRREVQELLRLSSPNTLWLHKPSHRN
jgi:integrase/recombinase XerD